MKRISTSLLAFFLVCCMVLSMLPMSAFAAPQMVLGSANLNLQASEYPHPFSTAGEAMLTWDDTENVFATYSQSEWGHTEYPGYYKNYDLAEAFAWEPFAYDAEHPNAFRSGNYGEGNRYYTYSAMSYTFSGATTLSFDYLLSFETCDSEEKTACDTLALIVDNRVVMQIAPEFGEIPSWKSFTYEITGEGTHTAVWVFNRDFFDSGTEVYDEAAYVDNIAVTASDTCDLSSAKLTYVESGTPNEMATNGGSLSFAANTLSELSVQFEDDGVTTYLLKVDGVEVTPVNGRYAIEDINSPHTITLSAMRPGSLAVFWHCSTEVSYSVDNIITEAPEGAQYSLSNDASHPWQAVSSPLGGAAAVSGNKNVDSSASALTLNVTVPDGETYYLLYTYAVSSEANYDWLKVYDGETEILKLSEYGADDETLKTVAKHQMQYELSSGSHAITWKYEKDGSSYRGCDAAFIMDVRILKEFLTATLDLSYDTAKGAVTMDGAPVEAGLVTGFFTKEYTLTETPAAGCYFSGWYSGDTLLSTEKTYSGTFGVDPAAIEARFLSAAATHLTVNWDSGISGVTCSVNGGEAAAMTNATAIDIQQGDAVTVTATVASGTLMGIYEGNFKRTSSNSYSFAVGDKDINLTVKTAENNEFTSIDGFSAAEGLSFATRPLYCWGLDEDGSLRNGNQGIDASASVLRVIPSEDGLLTFSYRTSSEGSYDCLYYSNAEITFDNRETSMNYEKRADFSGVQDWTTCSIPVQAGTPLFLCFCKDGSSSSGEDSAWVKDFRLETAVEYKNITINFPEEYGTILYNGSPITPGTTLSLPEGVECELKQQEQNLSTFQGWYADQTLLSNESSYSFTVSEDVTITAKYDPNLFADISGYTPGDGISSVQSRSQYMWTYADGILTSNNAGADNSVSIMKVVAAKQGLFCFTYRTSSEANYDVLYYSIGTEITNDTYDKALNSGEKEKFSGQMSDWETVSLPVNAGDVIYLGFRKDGSNPAGEDAAKIKDMMIVSGTVEVFPVSSDEAYGTVSGGGADLAVGSTVTVTATPAQGGQFYGWVIDGALVSTETSYSFMASTSVSPKAIFVAEGTYVAKKIGSVPAFYQTLADAMASASSGDSILLLKNATLSEDLTVPAGVTLVLPCIDNDTGIIDGERNPHGTTAAGNTGVGPNAYCYSELTVPAGVTLTINGSVVVNAVSGRPAAGHFDQDVTGGYAKINLDGSAVVNSGGSLYCFGYVSGSGSVTANTGGLVSDNYIVRHWRGGSQAFEMYPNVYPMNEYDCHNISTPIRINYGASYTGFVKMYASGSYHSTFFPQVDNGNGLIRLTSPDGYVLKTYKDGRECYNIYGGANFASSTLNIVGLDLATADFLYPWDGDIDFALNSGDYHFVNNWKFLPGTDMSLASDATLTVDSGVSVVMYDVFNDVPNTSTTQYPADRDPATLYVASGASFTNSGTFAGTVITQSPNILIGGTPAWNAETQEANGYCNGLRTLSFALSLTREGYPWHFGEDQSIVWEYADYTKVEEAIASIPADLTGYTSQSVAALRLAVDAVVKDMGKEQQAAVDDFASAILDAIQALEYKALTVSFDANGGTASKETADVTFNSAYGTLPTAERTGYTFSGWYTAAEGGKAITPETIVSNPENHTLYAHWTANTYTVTLDPNGGSFNAGVSATLTVTYGASYGELATPRNVGYEFAGWYLDETQITATDLVAVSGDHTLTAHWNESGDTPYLVQHYLEGLDGNYNTIYKTETLTGRTNSYVSAAAMSIPGFVYNPGHISGLAGGTIHADGSLTLRMYYTRNSYTLRYKDGEQSILEESSRKYDEALNLQSYSREGYDFDGWFTDAELTVPAPEKMPASDLTLYAKTTAKSYEVRFNLNGGEGETPEAITAVYDAVYGTLPVPTRTGYTFTGWKLSDNVIAEDTVVATAQAHTLVAQWQINSYLLSFDTDGGEAIEAQSVEYNAVIGTLPDAVKAGYRFDGWQTVPEKMPANDLTLKATYSSYLELLLALEPDAPDGDLATMREYYSKLTDSMKLEYAQEHGAHKAALWAAIQKLEETALVESVKAAEDSTNETLLDAQNNAIAVLTVNDDRSVDVCLEQPDFKAYSMLTIPFLKELFAHDGIQSIHFPALADDPAGLTPYTGKDPMQLMLRIAYATINDENRSYDDFKTWLAGERDTMAIRILDGKQIECVLEGVTSEGVSYGVAYSISFFNRSHDITWVFDNGAENQVNAVDYASVIEKPSEPTKTGYDFAGWEGYTEGMAMGKTAVTFTAQWTAKTFTVTLDAGYDGAEQLAPISVTYDAAYSLPTPAREGYTFDGWYLGENKIENNSRVEITENTTFVAHWVVGAAYTIIYELDGGALEPGKSNPEQYNVETESFTLHNPVKTGYTFLGWTGSNGEAPQKTVTVAKGSTGNKAFTANWEINRYTITYDTDGGSAIASVTQDYGTAVTPPDEPTKTGYSFIGWSSPIPETMPAENLVVTALWKINQYTITFDTDGGDMIEPLTQDYNTAVNAPSAPNKTGYTFLGWDKEIPATMPAEDLVITALWKINQYTITFDANGGSAVDPITQDYLSAITPPADPTRTGYTFAGWDKDIPAAMPAESMTLTAKWTPNTYTVSFDSTGGSTVAPITVTYASVYGELPVPERSGYTFNGWYTAAEGGIAVGAETTVEITENQLLYAHWNEKGDTPYRIEHYQQNVEGDGYTLFEVADKTGKTASTVEAEENIYTGFFCNEEKSERFGTIAGDGSTILRLYYDRKTYTVTWRLADRDVLETYRYQAEPSFKESTDRAADDHASYSFTGWDRELAAVTENTTYTAAYQAHYEAITVASGTTWRTVAIALANAAGGDTVRVEAEAVLNESAAVPAGVTLLIPCMDEDSGYVVRGNYLMNPDGTDPAGNTGVGPNAALYRSLTVAEGVTLTVNGTLLVNAVTGRPAAGHYDQDVTGGYAQIQLNGSMIVENGAHLDVFGYVRGSGSITVRNGGTVGDLYVVRNWRGGTQALKMYESDIYPMNEYDCHNIEAPLRVEYGGSLEGLVKMYAGGSYNYTRFPQINNENGLIRLKKGGYALRTFDGGREHYTIFGGADFASSTLKIVGIPLSTGDYLYPIDGDISFDLNSGAYQFVNNYKMLPGVQMRVHSDADLTVAPEHVVVFYKEFHDIPNTDNTQYPSDRPATLLKIDEGASFTNAGTFAGSIYTDSADILIGENPCWEAVTYEANGYVSGKPKDEHTVAINHALQIERPGHTWEFGEDLSIVWDGIVLTDGDYSGVEAALALIPDDLSVYTDESVQALNDAVAAVEYGLRSDHQEQIDAWAAAIREAVAGLIRKDIVGNCADYSAVSNALAQVPTDLDKYTDESVAVLQAAIDAVQYGLSEEHQAQVDAWATAILEAIAGLQEKPTDCDGGENCPSKSFVDIPDASDWAHKGIDYTVAAGLFNGTSETTFEPNTAMTRAMLVTVLWRYAGMPAEGENKFDDVSDGAWYADAVNWASANGIVYGIEENRFDPDGAVTREQVATIFYRYAAFIGADVTGRTELSDFADRAQVDDWAADALSWAVANQIICGSKENDGLYLLPLEGATRAQIATILMRFIEDYLK